ncbi:MAG: AsnC family transcriptional regulator [Promethearchaeota archaeon]
MKFEPSVLEDKRAWLLIKDLLGGRIKELEPAIDFTSPYGFRYPEAEMLLEASIKETVEKLQKLFSSGILEAQLVDTILLCSSCQSPQIHPQHMCPHCESRRIVRSEIIEHFPCGHIGPREDFKGSKGILQCPKCKKTLEGEKQDYQVQDSVQCQDCKRHFSEPRLVFQCFKCHSIITPNRTNQQPIFKYHLNPEYRGEIIHFLGYHPEPESERPTRQKDREALDAMDRRILNMLQADARQSFRTVARKLKVSDATIRDRVARLQKNEIIKAFTALVNPQRAGMELICLIQLKIAVKSQAQLLKELTNISEIKLVIETTESQNIFLLATFPSRIALNDFLNKHIRAKPEILLNSVSIALSLHKFDWKILFE